MYQGVIKKSRTLDMLTVYTFVSFMFPVLAASLPQLGLTVGHMAIFNIGMNAVLWWLRYQTTTAVGDKPE